MRIRSIKPEFWRSDDIAALSLEDRLLFIGLWSYVDDSGVGIDKPALICADLFALDMERDFREAYGRVTGGLETLSLRGLITRYTVHGKPYLYVNTWTKHQRIEKPSKARFPSPTCEDAVLRESSRNTPVALRDMSGPGAGEQGSRGTDSSAPATPSRATPAAADRFGEFWSHYPKKRDRGHAEKAWKTAIKETDPQEIIDGLLAQLPALNSGDAKFIPYGATWLNGKRWTDELTPGDMPKASGWWNG